MIRSYVIDDYFGNMAAVFRFDGDEVKLKITKTAEWFLDEYAGSAEGICLQCGGHPNDERK